MQHNFDHTYIYIHYCTSNNLKFFIPFISFHHRKVLLNIFQHKVLNRVHIFMRIVLIQIVERLGGLTAAKLRMILIP